MRPEFDSRRDYCGICFRHIFLILVVFVLLFTVPYTSEFESQRDHFAISFSKRFRCRRTNIRFLVPSLFISYGYFEISARRVYSAYSIVLLHSMLSSLLIIYPNHYRALQARTNHIVTFPNAGGVVDPRAQTLKFVLSIQDKATHNKRSTRCFVRWKSRRVPDCYRNNYDMIALLVLY